LNHIARTIRQQLHKFQTPQHISTAVWSYATLGHERERLFDAVAPAAMENLSSFTNPQSISSMVWAYAKVKHASSPLLFDAVAQKSIFARNDLCTEFNAQQLSDTLWSYASMRYTDSIDNPALFTEALSGVRPKLLQRYKMQHLTTILWSLSVLDNCITDVNVAAPFFSEIIERYENKEQYPTSSIELSQLYQALMWYNQENNGESLSFPPELEEECKSAFMKQQESSASKELLTEIMNTFQAIIQEDEQTMDLVIDSPQCSETGYNFEFVLKSQSEDDIGIEINGPSDFINQLPNGSTLLKRRQISKLGNTPFVSIPHWEWEELMRPYFGEDPELVDYDNRKKDYITKLIKQVNEKQ